jgi:hypothetical protein
VLANGTVIVAPVSVGRLEIEVPAKAIEVDRPLVRGNKVEFSLVRQLGRRLRLATRP